jgi:alkanesulfonate monooxygenase SsuD/methylene tetrahydromethanopterin reductase-like flavin-dependent oxidoreductase (luciferase family)
VADPWFGCFLPQVRLRWPQLRERARAAEQAGFHSVWLVDHLATPAEASLPILEGWTAAAALAEATDRIRIGHLVTCDAFRHPAVLAKMAATLDVISDGRLELGLGWGSVPDELERFGIGAAAAAERAARLAETLDVLELMFTGEAFDYRGRHVSCSGAVGRPRPVQQPRPPLHLGGAGPRLTLPLAAARADWWNCPSYAADRFAALRPAVRPARASIQRPVGLVTDPRRRDEVEAEARRRFGAWGGLVVGTAEEVAEVLAADRAAGAEGFVLQFHDFAAAATLEAFASEVMPRVP